MSTMTTSTQPKSSARLRLSSDDLDERGRSEDAWSRLQTSPSPGFSCFERLLDTARHLQRVRAGLLLDDQQQPGPSLMTASPMGAGKPSITSRHVADADGGAAADRARRSVARSRPSSPRSVCAQRQVADSVCRRSRRSRSATPSPRGRARRRSSDESVALRSRSGSTSTCSCRSRWPQIATLATPGTAIRRGRIVQRASVVNSICDKRFEVTPIFSTRLSEESGDSITGGRGRRPADSRPATAQPFLHELPRLPSGRVAFSKIRTTDDRPSTDFDRMRLHAGDAVERALERHADEGFHFGVDSPGASVCTSTSGGANSGKTSNGIVRTARNANTMKMTVTATTTSACRREVETSQRSAPPPLLGDIEFRAVELCGADGDDGQALGETAADRSGWNQPRRRVPRAGAYRRARPSLRTPRRRRRRRTRRPTAARRARARNL